MEPWRDDATVFHEDGRHPGFEARLRVADAGEPGDEVCAILVCVVGLLVAMAQHPL